LGGFFGFLSFGFFVILSVVGAVCGF